MSTNIYNDLKQLYSEAGMDLQEDLAHYLESGYIFSSPHYFIMGKQIESGWYIQTAVGEGSLGIFCSLMPHYLPYIGWRRAKKHNCEVVWHRTEQVLRKVKYALK